MSIESDVGEQFEDFFRTDDWSTFKIGADYYLNNAAMLLKKDINHCENNLKLLFRNIQKRIYIGIACEFLLKATYLKLGYVINKRKDNNDPAGNFPFKHQDVSQDKFSKKNTVMLNDLLQTLFSIVDFKTERSVVEKGLRIGKVFRNKEGHVICPSHEYVAQNYRDIEESLKVIYKVVFNQSLNISIAFAEGDVGLFEIDS